MMILHSKNIQDAIDYANGMTAAYEDTPIQNW